MTSQERRDYQERQRVEREDFKRSLAEKHGLNMDGRFDIAWNIAWDRGHSAGLIEVGIEFDEMVPLLKPL